MTTSYLDDDDRYAAVERRDTTADGHFVYAVVTTGVYCRPACGARFARRGNVRFHTTPADAERAGFRACRRCRPQGPTPFERDADLVRAAREHIERRDAPSSARAVARSCAANPIAVAIACHRVVRRDGDLGGYRWGPERKREPSDIQVP